MLDARYNSPAIARRPLVAPKPAPGVHRSEESAAEAKSAAMSITFGRAAEEGEAASFEARAMDYVMGLVAKIPGLQNAPAFLKQAGRYGGPFFATLAFIFGGAETAAHWKKMDNTSRALGVATTVASGFAAAAAIASVCVAGIPLAVVGGTAGLAGTLFAVGAVHQALKDPRTTAGQRGLTMTALGFQALGAALALTPAAGLGMATMLVGAHVSVLAGFAGKRPSVNKFFKGFGVTDGPRANEPEPKRPHRHWLPAHKAAPRP